MERAHIKILHDKDYLEAIVGVTRGQFFNKIRRINQASAFVDET